jgi:hypothetical protein
MLEMHTGKVQIDVNPSFNKPVDGMAVTSRDLEWRHEWPGDFNLEDYEAKPPQTALAKTARLGVKELTFASFNGEPLYMASMGSGETRIIAIYSASRRRDSEKTRYLKSSQRPSGQRRLSRKNFSLNTKLLSGPP